MLINMLFEASYPTVYTSSMDNKLYHTYKIATEIAQEMCELTGKQSDYFDFIDRYAVYVEDFIYPGIYDRLTHIGNALLRIQEGIEVPLYISYKYASYTEMLVNISVDEFNLVLGY